MNLKVCTIVAAVCLAGSSALAQSKLEMQVGRDPDIGGKAHFYVALQDTPQEGHAKQVEGGPTEDPERKAIADSIVQKPGWPDRDFLSASLSYTDSNGPTGLGVYLIQFVDAFAKGTKTWKKVDKGQWILQVEGKDVMTGKKTSLRILLSHYPDESLPLVIIQRVIFNGRELRPDEIAGFSTGVAGKAREKAAQEHETRK